MALVVLGYHNASTGGSLPTSFAYFWAGMALLFGYLFYDSVRNRSAGYPALNLVVAAIASAMPRIIRSPTAFYMNDELGHVLQVGRMGETGKLFLGNPIVTEARSYPGLETLTVGITNATHLPLIAVGLAFIVAWHVASVTGIYQLGRLVSRDDRVAFGAGLIYAVNPQMGQIDSWFAYEGFAVPLCIWALVLLLSGQQAPAGHRARLRLFAVVCALACIVTHHISGGFLVFGALLIGIEYRHASAHKGGRIPLGLVGLVVIAFVAWTEWRGANLQSYIGPYFTDGYHSLLGRITGQSYGSVHGQGGAGSRVPFGGASSIPLYERLATYLTELLLLVATVLVTFRWRRRLVAGQLLILVFAWLYFAALPLLLSAQGQQVTHRSWTYSYIGLSVVVAVAGKEVARLSSHAAARYRPYVRALSVRVGGSIAVVILLLGGYAAGVNYIDMFPGPFIFQSDGRDVSHELVGVADWLNHNGGHDAAFAADYRSSVLIAAYTLGEPEPYLALDIFQPTGAVPPDVVVAARRTLHFVVVDKRLTTDKADGNYFVPTLDTAANPLSSESITKLSRLDWLTLVHHSPHYLVYAVKGL